jgi:hypothetical protein
MRSARVIDVLTRLISAHGAPAFLRSDNVLNASWRSLRGNSDPGRAARRFDGVKR